MRIYDGNKTVRDERLTFTDPEPGWGLRNAVQAQVGIGDVDGDHVGEAIFDGRTEGDNWQVFVMDDLVTRPPPASGWTVISLRPGHVGRHPHPFAILDFDGDGVKDVFAQFRVLNLIGGATTQSGSATSTNTDVFPDRIGDVYGRPRVAVGDSTLTARTTSWSRIPIWSGSWA